MANYLPFNSILDSDGNPDRGAKAEDWAWYFSTFIGNGVFPKPTDGLQVVADEGMEIIVKAGFGFINGYAFRNQDDYMITIGTADGSLGRIDRVVLKWDLTNRLMLIDLKRGTPSAAPVAPTLIRTADTYELALADISVAAGTTTITQSMITDLRTDTELCGIVEGTVSQIDWSALTAQLNAFLTEYKEKVLSDYEGYTADIEEYEESFKSGIEEWEEGQQEDFETWFEHVRDQLDEDTAGRLQNQIDYLKTQTGIPDAYNAEVGYVAGDYAIRNDTLYKCMRDTPGGEFDPGYWMATTILKEVNSQSIALISDGEGFVLGDENGNAIVGDWKYKTA